MRLQACINKQDSSGVDSSIEDHWQCNTCSSIPPNNTGYKSQLHQLVSRQRLPALPFSAMHTHSTTAGNTEGKPNPVLADTSSTSACSNTHVSNCIKGQNACCCGMQV